LLFTFQTKNKNLLLKRKTKLLHCKKREKFVFAFWKEINSSTFTFNITHAIKKVSFASINTLECVLENKQFENIIPFLEKNLIRQCMYVLTDVLSHNHTSLMSKAPEKTSPHKYFNIPHVFIRPRVTQKNSK